MSKLQAAAAVATIIGVIIAAIALIPAFGQWLNPRIPTLGVAETSAPNQGAKPQQIPTAAATMAPLAQQTPKAANLSSVSLRLEDLPAEFKQMSQDELQALGFRMEVIATGYNRNFTGAQVNGYTAYRTNLNFTDAATDPVKFTMVESYIVSPLDEADIGRVDLLMQDPKTIAEFFSSAKTGAPIKVLDDLPAIGERSIGLETELAGDWGLPTRFDMQVVNARIQNAWLIIHVYYAKDQQPLVNIRDLASILGSRIETAYKQ